MTGGRRPFDDIRIVITPLHIRDGFFVYNVILACVGLLTSLVLLVFNIYKKNTK